VFVNKHGINQLFWIELVLKVKSVTVWIQAVNGLFEYIFVFSWKSWLNVMMIDVSAAKSELAFFQRHNLTAESTCFLFLDARPRSRRQYPEVKSLNAVMSLHLMKIIIWDLHRIYCGMGKSGGSVKVWTADMAEFHEEYSPLSHPNVFWVPPCIISNGYLGPLSGEWSSRRLKLTTYLQLVPK
jgi:hypothetical protein